MRTLTYQRHEYTWPDPEDREAPLSTFVYDVPYLAPCGIFPPLPVLNQCLLSGGSENGMSPGATWEPFALSDREYEDLVAVLDSLDPASLGDAARFTRRKYQLDHELDGLADRHAWTTAIHEKYGQAFRQGRPRGRDDA